MQRIEHIGIAVKNLDQAEAIYEALLGTPSYKREEVASEKVITSFFKAGQKIELLASTSEDGVIAKYIEKRERASTTSPFMLTTSTQKCSDSERLGSPYCKISQKKEQMAN